MPSVKQCVVLDAWHFTLLQHPTIFFSLFLSLLFFNLLNLIFLFINVSIYFLYSHSCYVQPPPLLYLTFSGVSPNIKQQKTFFFQMLWVWMTVIHQMPSKTQELQLIRLAVRSKRDTEQLIRSTVELLSQGVAVMYWGWMFFTTTFEKCISCDNKVSP